ncbi:hypothetical protein [Streptomyces sp. NPDC056713]|uniref:hypothetical protein n=1 Tax=Streptomyces sp. NPDC056713 TaxID=3345921 RepID=UPI0036C9B419
MLNSGVGRLNPRASRSSWAPPTASRHSPMAWKRAYAHLPADEYPDPTRAHIDEFSSVSQKALYDTAVEAVVAAIERAAGGS